ncbi:TIGR00366 family protein, partial [Pseudomonas aeruginosa]
MTAILPIQESRSARFAMRCSNWAERPFFGTRASRSMRREAVCWVALVSMLASLLNWGLSLVFGGLLVRALARRSDLRMDYR